MATKCTSCDVRLQERIATKEAPYTYATSGLDDLKLIGIKVRTCPLCHHESPTIPRPGELHRAVTVELIHKYAPLTGDEIRFMRKHARLPQGEFAASLGFTGQSHLCRVEQGKKHLSDTAERLVRVCVAAVVQGGDAAREIILAAGKKVGGITPHGRAVSLQPVMQFDGNRWRVATTTSWPVRQAANS